MKNLTFLITAYITIFLISASCNNFSKNKSEVKQETYGNYKGKEVFLFTLRNKEGNVLKLTSFGARIIWLEVPDKGGKKDNITFGYDTFEGMINGDPYFGALVGRYANRIAKGKFAIDDTQYNLALNNGLNSLHGGPGGWHSVVWDSEVIKNGKFPSVKFSYFSPDMEEGYPGNVNVETVYTWTDANEIVIEYKCTTDKKTVINVTNHVYFNLHGAGVGDILDHVLHLKASNFIPVDSTLIPTGEVRAVSSTPFDFTIPQAIGKRIAEEYDQLKLGNGYDHCYVLDNNEEVDASVFDPVSGRYIEVITDQPSVQFYCGNFLNGSAVGYGGKPYNFRSGLCLETQHYPDSPNQPSFPSTILNPGEIFRSITTYKFAVK